MEERSSPKKRSLSFEEILQLIEAHFNYLRTQQKYLSKIQKGEVANTEIKKYLADVFGFSVSDSEQKGALDSISETLGKKVTVWLGFMQIIKSKQEPSDEYAKDKLICILSLALEEILVQSNKQKIIKQNKEFSKEEKFLSAFEDVEFLKTLMNAIKNHEPEPYISEIKKIIEFSEHKKIKQQKTHQTSWSDKAGFTFKWADYHTQHRNYNKELLQKSINWDKKFKELHKNEKSVSEKPPIESTQEKSDPKESFSPEALEIRSLIDKIHNVMKKRMDENSEKIENIQTPSDALLLLKSNVETFFELYPLLCKCDQFSEKSESKSELKFRSEKHVIFLEGEIQKLKDQTPHIKSNDYPEDMIDEIKNIKQRTAELDAELSKNLKIDSKEKFEYFEETSKQKIETLKSDLSQIKKQMESYKKELKKQKKEQQESAELRKKELAESHKKQLEENKQARLADLKKRREADELYKKEVERKRAEKLHEKMAPKPITPQTEQEKRMYKNLEMEELLLDLSDNQIEMIKSIISPDPKAASKVTFDEVCYLITNHLGGEILEIGNGSSHKCIIMPKYIAVIDVHDEDVDEVPEINSQVKGGFWKAHGKKASRVLSPFNLSLVKDVFDHSGITATTIADVEKKKKEIFGQQESRQASKK